MRKRMPYNNMRNNNNMNRGNRNNNMRRPMRGGFDDEEIHPRQRKHAQNMREKYLNQARDAQMGGDRVQAEYWLQHAEHYSRILNAINEMFAPTHPEGGEHGAGADMAADEGGEHAAAPMMDGGEGADGQPGQQQRPFRQPRRPYQGQQQQGEGGQDGQQGQPRGRGQWRQPRERRPEQAPAEHAAPQEELALPLASVLPAARMDDDEPMA